MPRSAIGKAEAGEHARAADVPGVMFRHRDKDDSFTDCTSFVVMKGLRLKEALTTDRHFRQMGFRTLP